MAIIDSDNRPGDENPTVPSNPTPGGLVGTGGDVGTASG